ncbi:histidine kinase [Anaerobacillus alkalilacustris]|uniref:histidine kinase n=1 Tax=Anaerobacillus alkalilacustris TaxID=393763 RepID=A0A1S2LN91_9BACI|nr:histidine kinase N-terminal domain-containing protein [Anaerobacillus alkalilacustris]OIJ13951.1 histidine kinase [Anaerobacillus alkalilacustris]
MVKISNLIDFFEKNNTKFLEEWYHNIRLESNDIYKDEIKEIGLLMYQLVQKTLANSISKNELKEFAHKVAKKRVESNQNIGDFVYNVNYGRSLIINQVFSAEVTRNELQLAIERINVTFDHFCYFVVRKYTLLKEQQIEEKNLLINQSHKDKLSLLGQMSSSFVHEFRNPLTAVIGFVKLLKTDNPTLKYIDIIERELDQLKFRITQFLHTSKNEGAQEKRKEILTVQLLLEDIIKFLYPSIVDIDVNVSTNYAKDAFIIANENEIKQVFLNILMNSIDAINKKEKPREITVETILDKQNVLINITNNGPLIPDDTREVIFEPFYTTKELGTGIGLFVCRKIIEKHNGIISCISNEEKTTFSIQLPVLRKETPPLD